MTGMPFTPDPHELPVACTLGPADGMNRMQRWRRLASAADPVAEREDTRLTVRFAPRPGVLDELHALAAAERECCAFLDWDVSAAGQPTLRITAGSAEDLDAVAGLLG